MIYIDFRKATFLIICFSILSSFIQTQNVKLSEVEWHNTGCYKIEMLTGIVYFEKANGVSGFKSFIDPEGNDWFAKSN